MSGHTLQPYVSLFCTLILFTVKGCAIGEERGEGSSTPCDTSFTGEGGVIGEGISVSQDTSLFGFCGEGYLNAASGAGTIPTCESDPSGPHASYRLFCGEGHLNAASGAGMIQPERGTHPLHNLDTDDCLSLNGYG